jgi:hypothetical protein
VVDRLDTRCHQESLAVLDTVDIGCGLVLADDAVPDEPAAPTAALLPALDPTPMGWKERDWYLPADTRPLFDRNGNIGPTIWWGGEVIGGWAVRTDGEIATRLLVDRGTAAARAVRDAAHTLRAPTGGHGGGPVLSDTAGDRTPHDVIRDKPHNQPGTPAEPVSTWPRQYTNPNLLVEGV